MSGRDFWLMYPPHDIHQLYVVGEEEAWVYVESPLRNWRDSLHVYPNEFSVFLLRTPNSSQGGAAHNTPRDAAFHVTSTGNVVLYAMQYHSASLDMASVFPSNALGTRYIIQDYPTDTARPQCVFGVAAVEDNTQISFRVPNPSGGLDPYTYRAPAYYGIIGRDSVRTVTLMRGQDYWLASSSFSGMEVYSPNNKSFALFQGGQVRIDRIYEDYTFEQALPVKCWGTDFIVVTTTATHHNDRVRITSSDDSCLLRIDGVLVDTLQKGETYELIADSASAHHIRSCKPATVVAYTSGCGAALGDDSQPGDPSSVVIPPIDQGINHTVFRALHTSTIRNVFVNIVTTADAVGGMTLDGSDISAVFRSYENDTTYKYASIRLNDATHTLENTVGTFVAFVYGIGTAEAYSYVVGSNQRDITYSLMPAIDTITLCQGGTQTFCLTNTPFSTEWYVDGQLAASDDPCFDYVADSPGMHEIQVYVNASTPCDYHFFSRHVNVLPSYNDTLRVTIYENDAFTYEDRTLSVEGEYLFRHSTTLGCDSNMLVVLTVLPRVEAHASPDQDICIGDSASLSVEGTDSVWWKSVPVDSSLFGREHELSFKVSPPVTTRYIVCDFFGTPLDTAVVRVYHHPRPCIRLNSDVIEYDAPDIDLFDCSQGSVLRTWLFPNGDTRTEQHVEYSFGSIEGDSVAIALTTCTLPDCCSDTTVILPVRLQTIWFPNIFTPNKETNNRFQGIVNYPVREYELLVFNRFGICIFRTNDPEAFWDGTYDGRDLPQGSYAYKWRLKPTTDNLIRQGTGIVTLIR